MRVTSLMCSKSRAACRLTEAVFAWAVWHVSDYSFAAFFVARLKPPEPHGTGWVCSGLPGRDGIQHAPSFCGCFAEGEAGHEWEARLQSCQLKQHPQPPTDLPAAIHFTGQHRG